MADIDKAIADAAEQILEGAEGEQTEESTEQATEEAEETPTEESEETTETSESNESNLTEQELGEAKFLYNALKNPDLRAAVLTELLAQTKLPVETKEEVKSTKKEIKEIVEEALGPEFKFLAPALGKAIDAAITQEREERVADSQQREAAEVNKNVTSAMDALAKETKGESRKLEAKMAQLCEVIVPGPNASIDSYIRILYREASAGSTQKAAQAKIADKIRRNANDAPSRLQSAGRVRLSDVKTKPPTGKLSVDKAVNWAFEQLQQNRK